MYKFTDEDIENIRNMKGLPFSIDENEILTDFITAKQDIMNDKGEKLLQYLPYDMQIDLKLCDDELYKADFYNEDFKLFFMRMHCYDTLYTDFGAILTYARLNGIDLGELNITSDMSYSDLCQHIRDKFFLVPFSNFEEYLDIIVTDDGWDFNLDWDLLKDLGLDTLLYISFGGKYEFINALFTADQKHEGKFIDMLGKDHNTPFFHEFVKEKVRDALNEQILVFSCQNCEDKNSIKQDWGVAINPNITDGSTYYDYIGNEPIPIEENYIFSTAEFKQSHDMDWISDKVATYLLDNEFNIDNRIRVLEYFDLIDVKFDLSTWNVNGLAGLDSESKGNDGHYDLDEDIDG